MSRKRRFITNRSMPTDMSLQITSMADIFTIILVFLLKSFSTGVNTVNVNGDLALPEASTGDAVVESLKVQISPGVILLEDRPVTVLRNFQMDPTDLESNGTPRTLNTELIKERQKIIAVIKDNPARQDEANRLTIIADQKTPFSTLRSVMDAASSQGFADFKLIVVEKNG